MMVERQQHNNVTEQDISNKSSNNTFNNSSQSGPVGKGVVDFAMYFIDYNTPEMDFFDL